MRTRILTVLVGLMAASPALAQDEVATDLEINSVNLQIHVEATVQSAQALADWLTSTSAQDQPGSGGPSDIPMDITTLQAAPPDTTVSISNGFFRLAHPDYLVMLEPLAQEYEAGLLTEPAFEGALGALLTDVLVGAGAPVYTVVVVGISNGI